MNYLVPLVKESFYKEKTTKRKLINFIKNCDKFSMGEQTKQFEKSLAEFQNTKYCVYFSSGSAANLGLIQSLKNLGLLKNGDKVAISSLTWATNVMPIIQLGMIPVPIDIDIETLNISLEDLYSKYEMFGFKSIFLTNVLSFSCDMKKLTDFCDKNSILLIEDFSNTHFYSRFTFHDLAYNLRPGEINAFIGLSQLEFINQNLNKRKALHKKFQKQLRNKKSTYPLKILNNNYAPFAFTLIFKEKEKADYYLRLFHENRVEVRPVISGNIAKQPFFQKYHPENYLLPNCEIVHNQGVYFGVNPNLSKHEIEILSKLLNQIE